MTAPLPSPTAERRAQLGLAPRSPGSDRSLRRFDTLELGALLGEGAGAQVFLASMEGVGRIAAKVLRPDPPAGAESSLRREAEVLRRLDHPAVPRLLGRGTVFGRPALALEYVRGVTLLTAIGALADPGGPRSTRGDRLYLARALLSVARGLAHAHHEGWVHLDLKPANVVVRPDGSAALVDWGLAARDEGRVLGLRPRRSELIAGTPGYMAPEQVRGERPAAAADQFGLGLLLFEALTLRPAILGWTARERMKRTLAESLPDPRLIAPTDWIAEEPAAVTMRALAPTARERFESMDALAEALEAALAAPRRP